MIDNEGFRLNVGIVLCNTKGQLLWAKRIGYDAWQFPQGGVQSNETALMAMYRELWEEIGLLPEHVKVLGQTRQWLKYLLPHKYIRADQVPMCIGQKQKWFLLELTAAEHKIKLDCNDVQEFDSWQWVSYWYPVNQVIDFKQEVYRKALAELIDYLPYRRL